MKKYRNALLLLISIFFLSLAPELRAQEAMSVADSLEIVNLLKRQQADWNKGDIPAFMEGYLKSDRLTFTGSSGMVKGWQATLERYLRSYPDKQTMGQLNFSFLQLSGLGDQAALLIGRFHLSREIGDASGFFTLVLRKFDGQWKIVSDHTSSE